MLLPDADFDLAADALANAGFSSAGERCMAISASDAVGYIVDELVAKLAERARLSAPASAASAANIGRWSRSPTATR